MMKKDLQEYCDKAVGFGFTHAQPIHPSSVVTAWWVRMKCQFGCPGFGRSYCCPPDTPTPDQTRQVLDSYKRAILFHKETPPATGRFKSRHQALRKLVELEQELFKDGYYKALVYLAGPCRFCKECGKVKGEPCNNGFMARPAMEACGIDVFQTARNNRFFIQTLKNQDETMNNYCLMLVD